MNDSIFIRASEKKSEIKALEISSKTKFRNGFISLLIAGLICSGPICLFFNMIIFYDLMVLVCIGLAFSIAMVYYLAKIIYYKSLAEDKCGSLTDIYIAEFLYSLIIVLVLYVLL